MTNDGSLVYLIKYDNNPNVLTIEQIASTNTLNTGYKFLSPLMMKNKVYLLGYNSNSNLLDTYQFSDISPWISKVSAQPKINSELDIIEPFIIGNQLHLMCYTSKTGMFEFFALDDDLTTSKPYQFYRTHEPSITQGFTTIQLFTCFGQVVLLGYNSSNGYVSMYTLNVIAKSLDNVPPLKMVPVWSHQWAKGWTRFAFFQLGGETFFLKTNTWKPNVNIDHVLDNLSGTIEIGTNLDLKNAQHLEIVQSFYLNNNDPYFMTYEKSGEITLNRFNSNCLGWTTVASFKSKENAIQILPIAINDKLLILVT